MRGTTKNLTAGIISVLQSDLEEASTVRKHPLLFEYTRLDEATGAAQTLVYLQASQATTAKDISYVYLAGGAKALAPPAGGLEKGVTAAVALYDVANASYGFFVKKGPATIVADGTGLTQNNYVQVIKGTTTGKDAAGVKTAADFAVAQATAAAGTDCLVMLEGNTIDIA